MTPNWLAVAACGDLSEHELDDGLGLDFASTNLLAAMRRAIEVLERHERHDLAEQLCADFVRTFGKRDSK